MLHIKNRFTCSPVHVGRPESFMFIITFRYHLNECHHHLHQIYIYFIHDFRMFLLFRIFFFTLGETGMSSVQTSIQINHTQCNIDGQL